MAELAQQHKKATEQISPDGMPIAPDATAQVPVTPTAEAPPAPVETPTDAEHIAEQKQDTTDENVDIMDFLAASGRESAAKVEDKKEEVKPAPEVQPAVQKPVNARDYSDIEPAHKQAFERMSNEAFNLLKPVYLEHKQLKLKAAETQAEIAKREEKIKQLSEGKQTVPDSYYEHENAFVLTPEFAQASQAVNSYNTVLNHWQSQLDAVRAGNAETYQTIHVHPQTGEFYLSAPLPVDRTTEKQLQSYVQFAQGKMMESQAEINLLAKSHKMRHNEAINWVKNFETNAFKNIESNDAMKAMVRDTIQYLPPAFHSNPLASTLARALVTISQMGKLLQARAAQPAANGTPTKSAPVRGNLTAAEIAGDGGSKKADTSEVTFDDFKRVME